MVGNAENSSGVWMNSAVIRIRIDRMIEIASRKIEHHRGQRHDQHHEDDEDAERQREIAALQDVADVDQDSEIRPLRPCLDPP